MAKSTSDKWLSDIESKKSARQDRVNKHAEDVTKMTGILGMKWGEHKSVDDKKTAEKKIQDDYDEAADMGYDQVGKANRAMRELKKK